MEILNKLNTNNGVYFKFNLTPIGIENYKEINKLNWNMVNTGIKVIRKNNGNFLIERLDYVATSSTSFDNTIYRDLVFQYSKNNITNLIFQNTPTGGNPAQKQTTLISYNYDTSKAALPINSFQYSFDSVAFTLQEYAAANNLISIKYGDGASLAGATYEYNYLTVGKPNTANLRITNANGDALVSKIEFFYD